MIGTAENVLQRVSCEHPDCDEAANFLVGRQQSRDVVATYAEPDTLVLCPRCAPAVRGQHAVFNWEPLWSILTIAREQSAKVDTLHMFTEAVRIT